MPDDPNDLDRPMDRRRFFRRGLSELLRPIASAIAPLERAARKLGELEQNLAERGGADHAENYRGQQSGGGIWLRPPGAISEKSFLSTCTRSGECVQACPAHCIKIEPPSAGGAPFIDADTSACVVCNGLYCMHVCPSGALVPTSINDIDMGTAVWHEETCLRTTGGDCQVCVDDCPLGQTAIQLNGREIAVQPLGCIGCGICQEHCPTKPKSIAVIPRAAKEH